MPNHLTTCSYAVTEDVDGTTFRSVDGAFVAKKVSNSTHESHGRRKQRLKRFFDPHTTNQLDFLQTERQYQPFIEQDISLY